MVFVRKKRIKGKEYFYLAKTVRKGSKVSQITLEYLGAKIPDKIEIERFRQKYK